jgi:transposase
MTLSHYTRKPLTEGQIVTITVTLSVAAAVIAWVLLVTGGFFAPQTQDCYDWATQKGESESNATFLCHWAWNDGYDTSDITEAEYDSLMTATKADVRETTDLLNDAINRMEGN